MHLIHRSKGSSTSQPALTASGDGRPGPEGGSPSPTLLKEFLYLDGVEALNALSTLQGGESDELVRKIGRDSEGGHRFELALGHDVIEALAYRSLVEGHDGEPARPDVLRDLINDGASAFDCRFRADFIEVRGLSKRRVAWCESG